MDKEKQTQIDVYNKIIDSMKISVKNMDWLIKNIDKKIINAVEDKIINGEINTKDIIIQLLDSEKNVSSKRAVYSEIIERCTNEIAIIDGTIDLTNGDKEVF